MERRRAMFSRFLFCFLGGADNSRRGQREERTAGVVDSWECGGRRELQFVRGQREVYEELTARMTTGGEESHNGGY